MHVMRATAVIRRSAVAASALSLALVVTACGGSGESGEDEADATPQETAASQDPSGDPASPEPEEGADAGAGGSVLTAAELEAALLVTGDVDGYDVGEPVAGDVVAVDEVALENAACEPLAHAVSGVPVGEAAASAHRRVTSSSADGAGASITIDSLYSYEGAGAEDAVAALRDAATGCADGFTVTQAGEPFKVTGISEESITAGEEAYAWTLMVEVDADMVAPAKFAVVRQGSTVATFSTIDVMAVLEGTDYDVPTDLIDAQVGKLG